MIPKKQFLMYKIYFNINNFGTKLDMNTTPVYSAKSHSSLTADRIAPTDTRKQNQLHHYPNVKLWKKKRISTSITKEKFLLKMSNLEPVVLVCSQSFTSNNYTISSLDTHISLLPICQDM